MLENVRLAAQRAMPHVVCCARCGATIASVDRGACRAARVGLASCADRVAGTLSHGQLRQLEIAVALATQPKVLLLDEPLAGMGPEESATFAALLRELARDHAVLLVEHDMDVVFAVARPHDRDGRRSRAGDAGTPDEIRAIAAVRDAYLGHGV